MEIRKYTEPKNCENSTHNNEWYITKLTLRRNFIALYPYKGKKKKINELTSTQLKKFKKGNQNNSKENISKDFIKRRNY